MHQSTLGRAQVKFPKPLTITSRTSSITNSFVQAIIPSIEPSKEERDEALQVLGMSVDTISCIYCGANATDWDHLRPFVRNKVPTGYVNEIRNLVPACGPCNQSKSGSDWRTWMMGRAPGSPKTKGVADVEIRMERIEQFEKWGCVEPISLRELAGEEMWDAYWGNLKGILDKMAEAQATAANIREAIRRALADRTDGKQRSRYRDSMVEDA